MVESSTTCSVAVAWQSVSFLFFFFLKKNETRLAFGKQIFRWMGAACMHAAPRDVGVAWLGLAWRACACAWRPAAKCMWYHVRVLDSLLEAKAQSTLINHVR